jgi:hypothetical protein
MTAESGNDDAADPVIAIAEEYEAATLAALAALEGDDIAAQMTACVRFGQILARMRAMSPQDLGRVNTLITERGRIPDFAWRKIVLAMQNFAIG